jgi:hypothetical protein
VSTGYTTRAFRTSRLPKLYFLRYDAWPLAGDSLLALLPPEQLETIILKTIVDVAPPLTHNKDGYEILHCSQDSQLDNHILSSRVVSRTIRNSSWRPLAKGINEAIFDLCSQKVWKSPQHLSAVGNLHHGFINSPSSCFLAGDLYPVYEETAPLDVDSLDTMEAIFSAELSYIRTTDKTWFPTIWSWAQRQHQHFALGASLGLQILIEARVASGTQPKTLDLVVDTGDPPYFFQANLATNMKTVLRDVEDLVLRERFGRLQLPSEGTIESMLSKSNIS